MPGSEYALNISISFNIIKAVKGNDRQKIKNFLSKSEDARSIKKHIENNSYNSGSRDLHIIRFYSSYVVISNGRVIKVTKPSMKCCPLAGVLYSDIDSSGNLSVVKDAIKRAIESKISEFGCFTEKRKLFKKNIAMPYGASEILMYALKEKAVDTAVVVLRGSRNSNCR